MSKLLTAAIQLNSQPDLNHNMKEIYRWIEKAAEKEAKLICLPENFAFMGHETERLRQAKTISETVEKYLPQWAGEFGVYLLGGGFAVPADDGKVMNRSVLMNPEGETAAVYDKIHLFDVKLSEKETYLESGMVQPGKNVVVTELTEFELVMGLSVCYDVRFPELYRKQAEQGADILTVPAAFTRPTGRAHWEILLRARAIENSAYVVAPAQTGKHGSKRETYGHSMIIDPWGKILAEAGTEPGIITAELDLSVLDDVRRKLPSLKHRVL